MSEIYLNLSTNNDNVEHPTEARLHLGGMRSRLSLFPRTFLALALVTSVAACDDPGPTAPIPEVPVVETVTSTYTGILSRNGAITFPFRVESAGTATASLTEVGPDNTIALGLTMGTWNGLQCAAVISNDNALENATITGSAGSAGSLCLRVHDVGRLSTPITFTIRIVHP